MRWREVGSRFGSREASEDPRVVLQTWEVVMGRGLEGDKGKGCRRRRIREYVIVFRGPSGLCRFLAIAMLIPVVAAGAVTPGGLTAGHAYASSSHSGSQMTSTITIDVDPGITSYFWAQQFWLATAVDHGGYFGVQGNGVTNGQAVGKMLIFSIWNASGATADPGAVAQQFGGEGVGWSIHRAYAWQAGVGYAFTLAKEGATGWRVSVHTSTGEEIGLGRIEVAEDALLSTGFANFTEYYTNLPSCDALPFAQATFSGLTYGGAAIAFNDTAPYGNCESRAEASLPTTSRNVHRINAPDVIFNTGFET